MVSCRARVLARLIGVATALALAVVGAGTSPTSAATFTTCTGALSTVEVEALHVPPGSTCTVEDVTVLRRVVVDDGATLSAIDTSFSVGGPVQVRSGATLEVASSASVDLGTRFDAGGAIRVSEGGSLVISMTTLHIAGGVRAEGAANVVLNVIPFAGSSGTVGGSVRIFDAGGVALLGVEVAGGVAVNDSGQTGSVQVGGVTVGGSLRVVGTDAVALASPLVFALVFNEVAGNMIVVGNDTTGTIEPPLVGSNVVGGNLVCDANDPAPVNDPPGGPLPNLVQGLASGQCAGL